MIKTDHLQRVAGFARVYRKTKNCKYKNETRKRLHFRGWFGICIACLVPLKISGKGDGLSNSKCGDLLLENAEFLPIVNFVVHSLLERQ